MLEANAGYIADEESFLAAVADAQRIAIAAAEVSLDPVGVAGAGGAMATGGDARRGRPGGGGDGERGLRPRRAAASPSGSMASGM